MPVNRSAHKSLSLQTERYKLPICKHATVLLTMKFLIIGLGNIGSEYVGTRHNIGFEVMDDLVMTAQGEFKLDRHAYVAKIRIKGKTLIVLKPTTYVNLSGKALKYWMDKEDIPLDHTLVVLDDLNLPFGKQRLRKEGSDGGHNGLKNIQAVLNSTAYARLRLGIGADFHKGQQIDFVLGRWTTEEMEKLGPVITRATDTIISFVTAGMDRTISQFNN